MRVSVVVVNWNRKELLRACLCSLARQTLADHEVIVIDNGSTDGSAEMIGAEFPAARLLRNPENRGFAAANNQGFAEARGPLIALLNNDAEAEPRWLEELARAFEQGADVGMAAPKILRHEDPTTIDKVGHLIYPDGQNRGRGTGERDDGQYDRVEEIAWPDGAAAMYRKTMLGQVGGFDEDFFAYAEDADLGMRARIAGWRCLYIPTARVLHHHSQTLGRFSEERLVLIERNRIWLAAKLFPPSALALVPLYYALRVAVGLFGVATGHGEAARFGERAGLPLLARSLLRANLQALRGLPRILRKRASVKETQRLSNGEIRALLKRYRIPLRDIALKSN